MIWRKTKRIETGSGTELVNLLSPVKTGTRNVESSTFEEGEAHIQKNGKIICKKQFIPTTSFVKTPLNLF